MKVTKSTVIEVIVGGGGEAIDIDGGRELKKEK